MFQIPAELLYVWKEQENIWSQAVSDWTACGTAALSFKCMMCAWRVRNFPTFSPTWLSNEASLTVAPHLFPPSISLSFWPLYISFPFCLISTHYSSLRKDEMMIPTVRWSSSFCSVLYSTTFTSHYYAKLHLNGSKFMK